MEINLFEGGAGILAMYVKPTRVELAGSDPPLLHRHTSPNHRGLRDWFCLQDRKDVPHAHLAFEIHEVIYSGCYPRLLGRTAL
jgi:hypothetical protein